jgi:formate dehydrogenase accessory protein FdhD
MPQRREVHVQRWRDGKLESVVDQVAEEQPIALSYQGIPHVVMMATPAHLEELGVGFTLTEAIVQHADEIKSIEVFNAAGALEVRLGITAERFSAVLQQRRNLAGRTGCGVCGAETIEQAMRHPAAVGTGVIVSASELQRTLATLHAQQPLNAQTGSVHAAAWCLPDAGIQVLREDVGRHNALDKVIGALVRANIDCTQGYLIITSRASYEMVQKAATVGITLLVAVSAPTALAIRLAEEANLTLIGFARANQHVIYTHPQRLFVS